jgi:DNA modification methylase
MLISEQQRWHVHNGDCIEHMFEGMPESSVDFSVFSPPFPAMYAYTDSEADLGNVDDLGEESLLHFKFFFNALERVLKPGRVALVHCCQIPRMKRCGGVGMHDFRGFLIRLGERAGLVYEYDWLVPKNPQAQAIRTRSREMQFAGLESDRAKCRGAIPDYLIKFRKAGENASPLDDKAVTRNEWIDWAEAVWTGIRETDTLNVRGTKGDGDTKHICPLQLGVIRRAIKLFSKPGEIVFSPFTGIGSEGFVSVDLERRFYGCELKPEYHRMALKNIASAEKELAVQESLFG